MRKKIVTTLIIMFFSTAAFSLAFRQYVKATPDEIVILTPHFTGIQNVADADFKAWYETKTGRGVTITWVSKDTATSLALVREAGGDPAKVTWDVWWGGGLDAFKIAESENLLEPFYLPNDSDWLNINASIPPTLFGLPLKDLTAEYGKYTWWGSALSGFGIMYNIPYLDANNLPVPKDWTDLTNPVYSGHIVACPPSKSGSNHMIVEIILQYYGWEEGWAILTKTGGNIGEYTEKSHHVPPLIGRGEYGIAPVIDFYGLAQVSALGPNVVGFFYPPADEEVKHTVINPDSAAILKGAPHPETAKWFMKFVLGYDGQKMLFKDPINRLAIREDVYAVAPAGYFNPFETTMQLMTYNDTLSTLRWDVVNSLYDTQLVGRRTELSSAWSAFVGANSTIAEAEAAGYDVAEAKSLLADAESALTSMPITEAWSKEFGKRFHDDAAFRGEQISAWDTFAISKYSNATQFSREASEKSITFVIQTLRDEAARNLYYGLSGGAVTGIIVGAVITYAYYRRKKSLT